MTRSLSLQDPFKKKKINHSLPVAAKSNARLKQNSKTTRKSSEENHEKKEYVLDPKPAPLTLGKL